MGEGGNEADNGLPACEPVGMFRTQVDYQIVGQY